MQLSVSKVTICVVALQNWNTSTLETTLVWRFMNLNQDTGTMVRMLCQHVMTLTVMFAQILIQTLVPNAYQISNFWMIFHVIVQMILTSLIQTQTVA